MKRLLEFYELLKSGSWMSWGLVIWAAGQAGVAQACAPEVAMLSMDTCATIDTWVQNIGAVLGLAGFANAPGIRRPNG